MVTFGSASFAIDCLLLWLVFFLFGFFFFDKMLMLDDSNTNSHFIWFSCCSVSPHSSFHFKPVSMVFSLATFSISHKFLIPLLELMIPAGKLSYSGKQWSMFDFTIRVWVGIFTGCLELQPLINPLFCYWWAPLPIGSSQKTIYAYLTSIDSCGLLSIKYVLRCFSKLEPWPFFFSTEKQQKSYEPNSSES